jgi:hypothetical protein
VYEITYKELTGNYYCWLRVNVNAMPLMKKNNALLVITFLHGDKAYNYKTYPLFNDPAKIYEWNKIQADYLTPEVRNENDKVQVYIWNKAKENFAIENLIVGKFELE